MEEKTKILIVDDEPLNLDFFDVMLSNLGFEVEKAEDGEVALDLVREFEPDLLLLDNIMPKLSGWEVTRALKTGADFADYRDIPIIMFSAMDDVKDKVEGFELGIEDYIIKPFNFSEVLARIRAVLRHRTLANHAVVKERQLIRIESLNQSLIYFTQHLKAPVVELKEFAEGLNKEDPANIQTLVSMVVKETEEVLAALHGLEEEIQDLEGQQEQAKSVKTTLQDLESKFQKHFQELKEEERKAGGVNK
ncbi:MAG: response regulator [Spirochaetales bacterium]|jgi:DNA-binding response OmpR family regulator|nr:response regulator [Spirochaetales bacterium]